MPFAAIWMDLQIILLTEVSQTKTKPDFFVESEKNKTIQMNLYTKKKWIHRKETKLWLPKRKGEEG